MNSGEEEPKTPRRVREWTGFTRRCPMPLLTTEQVRLQLTNGGFVAAEEEAIELVAAADGVAATLDDLLQRRLSGEPLAWITGTTTFMGHTIAITPGVYVPRWQSESLARRAVELCPPHGRALDLCTGSGAIAAVLARAHPEAQVIGGDLDLRAVECARRNGIDAYRGDLFDAIPAACRTDVDLITAVVPYVPTTKLDQLARDTLRFETSLAYDGGPDGLVLLRRVALGASKALTSHGSLLLEAGPDQIASVRALLDELGFVVGSEIVDGDDEIRGIEARMPHEGAVVDRRGVVD